MVRSERRHNWSPHVAGVAEAVQQHDRRPLAADSDVDRRAVRRNILDAKVRRKPRDCGAPKTPTPER
jgi:hypothetical protein